MYDDERMESGTASNLQVELWRTTKTNQQNNNESRGGDKLTVP